jgi:hypothetical protein
VWRKLRSLVFVLAVAGGVAHAQGELALLRIPDARGNPLDLDRLRGQVVAVTFASRYTQKDVRPINEQLATRAQPGDATVVSVIDFEGIPRMFHGYAKGRVAQSEQPGRIQLVVDVQSALRNKFGADPLHRVDIFILDRAGSVRGHFLGKEGVEDAMRLVDELRRTPM